MRLPIRIGGPGDAAWISEFLRNRWGGTTIVVHEGVIEPATLPALVALSENRRGLATYRRLGRDAELVTLDAEPAGIGTGTALVEALAARLRGDGCSRLWLTTTNDKLSAMRFYLRRGFRLIEVRLGAVDADGVHLLRQVVGTIYDSGFDPPALGGWPDQGLSFGPRGAPTRGPTMTNKNSQHS